MALIQFRRMLTAAMVAAVFIGFCVTFCATTVWADLAPIKPKADRDAAVKAAAEAKVAAAAAKDKPPEPAPGESPDPPEEDPVEEGPAVSEIRGSRVTLKGEMSLSDALAELEEQTENRLVDYRGRLDQTRLDPTIELDLDDVSYWDAVESVLEKAELTLYAYTNIPNTLGIAARPAKLTANPPVYTQDLFRVQVISLNASRDLRDDNSQSLDVTLEVTWEPRYAPLVISQKPEELEVVGDNGDPLDLVESYGSSDARVLEGIGAVELVLPFELPARSMQNIASLNGVFRAQIPTRRTKFTFKDDLDNAKDIVKRGKSISVVLQSIRKNRDLYDVRLILKLDGAAEELKMQQGWIYGNSAYFVDPDGKRIDYAGLEMFKSTQEEIGLSYKFEAKGDDLKGYQFVYESPSDIATVPVKYELKGIELP